MRCSTMFGLIVGSTIAAHAWACDALPSPAQGDIAADPAALRIFWKLLEQARMGFSNLEEAAFLVRDGAGHVTGVPWPPADEPNSGRWVGAFPANTIAIVHTHPNWMPSPSKVDVRTAQTTRIPVYVITRSHISKTVAGTIMMLVEGEWKPPVTCAASLASASALR